MKVFNICNNCFQINDGEWIYCQSYSSLVAMYSFERSKLVLGRKAFKAVLKSAFFRL